jgi:serine-type D-Ala-D-Ala endopeptidase (penicillin-binding protein 7)
VKFILKSYMLFFIAASFVLVPVKFSVAKTEAQKSSYTTNVANKKQAVKKAKRKKVSYKARKAAKRRARVKARRLALAKQRAIDLGENYDGSSILKLASNRALVVNQNTGEVVYAKNTNVPSPIASITKLMTAMVVLDARQPFDEIIYISDEDVDTIKGTRSRLPVGTSLSRSEMLQLALMSSENRAAFALASNYPGGRAAFVKAMNAKALSLGLMDTKFAEPTGLMYQNVSTAEDLYRLVSAAHQYPEIRNATTTPSYEVYLDGREKPVQFKNTNSLVRAGEWDIGLSKTGYINEAGRCLVMQTTMAGEPMIVVFLDAAGTNKRTGDANRVRKWVEYNSYNTVVAGKEDSQPQLVMTGNTYEN